MSINRLTDSKNFVRERKYLVFNMFVYLELVEGLENRRDVTKFGGFDHGTSKSVLDLLKTFKLAVCKSIIQLQ